MGTSRRTLSTSDTLLIIAIVVGLASVFLPWLTITFSCGTYEISHFGCSRSPHSYPFTTGFRTGWGLLYFVLILNVACFLFIRKFSANRLALPVADWLVYLIAWALTLGVALLQLVELPPADTFMGESLGVAFGWLLALVSATAIGVAAFLERSKGKPWRAGHGWRWTLGLVIGVVILDGLTWVILFVAPCVVSPYTCR